MASAQHNNNEPVTRMARVIIDSSKLNRYKTLLKEQMETAVRVEAGVISYPVYADKSDPGKMTIVEVYANDQAYLEHRDSPHFKKYTAAVSDMVKSLELSEVQMVVTVKKDQ